MVVPQFDTHYTTLWSLYSFTIHYFRVAQSQKYYFNISGFCSFDKNNLYVIIFLNAI